MSATSNNYWIPVNDTEKIKIIEKQVKELANRLKNPLIVRENTLSEIKSVDEELNFFLRWNDAELGSGYPGICLFLGNLDTTYPNEFWDEVGLSYMRELKDNLPKIKSLGMWSGLTGMGMTVRALSRNGTRYMKLLNNINQHLLMEIPNKLLLANRNLLQNKVMASDYDVIQGLSGIGRYLLFYHQEQEYKTLIDCILHYLVSLTEEKIIKGAKVPSWYIPRENLFSLDRTRYPNGYFNLGVSHGITGPLCLLAIALEKGIEVKGQVEAMKRISDFLVIYKQEDDYGIIWPQCISWEDLISNNIPAAQSYESWCYGSPGISRALWLAGNVLNENQYKQVATNSIMGTTNRPIEKWNLVSPTFCHGYAGLLHIIQRMNSDTANNDILSFRDKLIDFMLNQYNSEYPFCYSKVQKVNDEIKNFHSPGLIDGASGIGLVLLSLTNNKSPDWDSAFLIS